MVASGSGDGFPRLPAVRLPAELMHTSAGEGADRSYDDDGTDGSHLRMDLATSKFSFEVPADSRTGVVQAVTDYDYEFGMGSSESEGEGEYISSADHDSDMHVLSHNGEHEVGSPLSTPTNRLHVDTDPLDPTITAGTAAPPAQPRLSRAFSMPVSSQLGYLKRRVTSTAASSAISEHPDATLALTSEVSHLHAISLELADSVQMVIQTLLQLSPPQVLDPAKEQFAACSVSIPTPSLSAIFTSAKNLNYMAANMAAFGAVDPAGPREPAVEQSDFDIGELLQSVGDAVSGVAAEVGVDVVLYHADVGMKHVAVRGDECGISYAVTHVSARAWAHTLHLNLMAQTDHPTSDLHCAAGG
jgi:osomolarity two-component system response regulator SSK1